VRGRIGGMADIIRAEAGPRYGGQRVTPTTAPGYQETGEKAR